MRRQAERSDVTPLLDACYAPTGDDQRWASDVVATFREAFRCFDEAGLYVISCDAVADSMSPTLVAVPPQWLPMVDGSRTAAFHSSRSILYGRDVLTSLAVLRPRTAAPVREYWDTRAAVCGIDEAVGLVVHPTPTTTLMLCGTGALDVVRERKARTALTRIALHLNARTLRQVRALTRREVDVLELASTGLSNKLCGYALGLSPAAISMALTNAAQKLGALTQLELLRVAALLAHDPRADTDETSLTAAEHEILALLRQGLSNADIAAQRGRSVRTIANQVASLLEKTRQPSRRALIARTVRSKGAHAILDDATPS
jgi:DNA-binding CsgD family transcriptional regulator